MHNFYNKYNIIMFIIRGICSNEEKDPIKLKLDRYFEPFAEAYREICEKQSRQFFGLRDFYRLADYDILIILLSWKVIFS